ncbi:MAG: tRNA 5-methylaminomethyl-2-thiouridine biosynthesis bifunctional protein MnmC [Candidatus Erwinia impunctatus]|nr:tRNA 5-methylaminomethyl-2-thiouridine biosynthesis bifunctional protein MnmC [Culicoides impunctatus]
MPDSPIGYADLRWNEQGTPVSRVFDDIYFSSDMGPEETQHVFLQGNDLPARFMTHDRALFVVAETGFGTGLNFLSLWQAFDLFREQHPDAPTERLHFISVEQYPLKLDDLCAAHAHWPALSHYATALQRQWPVPLPGCQRLLFEQGRVTLDLWFGDVNQLMGQVDDSLFGQVDAWFLDGFSPAKNPGMWHDRLFQWMAKLARPAGTFSTFTAAGFVRRGLQDAGFRVEKHPGFGKKREMLKGFITSPLATPHSLPWACRPAASGDDVTIIGGGIASILLALALLRRGKTVTLCCADAQPATGASGNLQGALYPLLAPHDPALTRFFPQAFTFARRLYDELPVSFDHQWCGVTQLGWDEKSRQKIAKMLDMALPESIVRSSSAERVAKECGLPCDCSGLTYPLGGWLSPAQLTRQLFILAQQQGLIVYWQTEITEIELLGHHWRLLSKDNRVINSASVVLATGHTLNRFTQTAALPVYAVSGQVSHIPSNEVLFSLKQVLCYDGYLTPVNPHNQYHCIGASYHRDNDNTDYRPEDQHNNRQRLLNSLPGVQWPHAVDISEGKARCGVRCATRDHLPMVGPAPDFAATLRCYADLPAIALPEQADSAPVYENLFILGALGSRGLCSAPLAAEVLAAEICNEPQPLDRDTLAALHPNRYWVRKLRRGKPVTVHSSTKKHALMRWERRFYLLEKSFPHAHHQYLVPW